VRNRLTIYIISVVLFLPVYVFSQQDSIKQAFKIGDYYALLSGKFYSKSYCNSGDCPANVSEIVADPIVSIRGNRDSAKVVGFWMSIGYNGVFGDLSSPNDSLTKEMIERLYQASTGTFIIIKYVQYRGRDGHIDSANGVVVQITESGQDALIKKSTKFASIGGITKSGNISFRALKSIKKLTIQGGATTDKIVSFELHTPIDTVFEKVVSKNEYFTPRMNYLMQMCPNMAVIEINNVHIISNGQDCIIPGIKLTLGNEE
jgi:hypothetical protein